MTTTLLLPAGPDLEHLKKQARQKRHPALLLDPQLFRDCAMTALGMALHHQHWPVVEVLRPITNNLLDACRIPDVERARFLLSREPELIRQRTAKGHTALHVVSQSCQEDPDLAAATATIALLLQYGADPSARNDEGRTPEQWYRQLGMDEVADYLSGRSGAD